MRILLSAGATLSLATLLAAQAPCWETSLGLNLNLGDDAYASNLALGFTFNFGGLPYTAITVCSNGYIWMGSGAAGGIGPDYTPDANLLTTQGPRMAPLWMDFNPAAAGSGNVWFNTFPASGGSPARAVLTWNNVYEYNHTTPLSMQVQLLDTGEFYYHYDSNMSVVLGGFGTAASVVGASDGLSPAHAVNFMAPPVVTTTPTATQVYPRGNFALTGHDLDWIPAGNGYVVVHRTQCGNGTFQRYGYGCPRNNSYYEIFNGGSGPTAFDLSNQSIWFVATGAGGYLVTPGPGMDPGYTTTMPMGDDTILTAQALGFNFPFAGSVHTAVDLSSNGMVYMASSTIHGTVNGYPTLADILTDPAPIIAFLWQDLDLSSGGTAYWDVTANSAMYTIIGAPYYGLGGSNDAQLKLFPNGDIVMSWGNCASTASGPLAVAISEGNNAADLGPTDWSTALPFTTSPAGTVPVSLDPAPGSRPAIGTTFTLNVSQIPSGTTVGALVLSFTQQNSSTAPYGMPGCWQLLNLDFSTLLLVNAGLASQALPIPSNLSLIGVRLFSQAATMSPGYNPLGVVTSNGGEIHVGY